MSLQNLTAACLLKVVQGTCRTCLREPALAVQGAAGTGGGLGQAEASASCGTSRVLNGKRPGIAPAHASVGTGIRIAS